MIDEIIKEYLQEHPFVMPNPLPGSIQLDGENYKYHFKYDSIEHFEKRKPDLTTNYGWERMKLNIQEGDEIWMLANNGAIVVRIFRDGKKIRDSNGHLDCNTFMVVGGWV